MSNYIVEAVYAFTGSFAYDKRLAKAVGRDSDGSGAGMGERDNRWYYKRKFAAKAALKRIRAARIRGVRASLYEEND